MGQEDLPNVTVSFYIKPLMEELGVLTWSRPNLAQEELVMKTNLRKGGQVSTESPRNSAKEALRLFFWAEPLQWNFRNSQNFILIGYAI